MGEQETEGAVAVVTHHAVQRSKQRMGLPKKAVKRMADKALNHGKKRNEFTGSFRKYLDCLYYRYEHGDLIVYGQNIYVFHRGIMLTVLRIPKRFYKMAMKKGKKDGSCRN